MGYMVVFSHLERISNVALVLALIVHFYLIPRIVNRLLSRIVYSYIVCIWYDRKMLVGLGNNIVHHYFMSSNKYACFNIPILPTEMFYLRMIEVSIEIL